MAKQRESWEERKKRTAYAAFHLPHEMVDALDAWAKETERTRSQLLRLIVARALKERQEGGAEEP